MLLFWLLQAYDQHRYEQHSRRSKSATGQLGGRPLLLEICAVHQRHFLGLEPLIHLTQRRALEWQLHRVSV
jgi:hypothetical protein